jgi:hypothetical protein
MRNIYLAVFAILCLGLTVFADVRIKQRVSMSGQKFESTRSIKGSRERTEQKIEMGDPSMADYMPQIATITQCDLKRTVRLNDRKQLYMVEPFQTAADTTVTKTTPEPTRNVTTRQGGTMTFTYAIKDTGERKTMFGLQARHLIITQEMESSADSCSGPSKMKMEFDGWYVDFSAEFNCPQATPPAPPTTRGSKPDCIDKYVYKGNAAARLGFLLEGTMKMFGQDGSVQMTQTTETLELSRSPLDASLFDIPASYKQANSSQELYAVSMPSMGDMTGRSRGDRPSSGNTGIVPPANASAKSVAVNVSLGSGAAGNQSEIESYVRSRIAARGLRAVSGSGDYTLSIQFNKIKESTAGKIGGMFGKVTGVPTGGVGKVDIDMTAALSGAGSGQAKVKDKLDGPAANAIHAAIDQALDQLLEGID